jgi:hypothetical protein
MDHVVTAGRADSADSASGTNDFTGWLPIRLFPHDGTLWVDWCYRGTHRFCESFFRDDVHVLLRQPFNLAFRRYTPISALVDWAATAQGRVPLAPLKALIAHASRCGSTLVAQLLAHLPTHVVMSEPPMVDVILSIRSRLPQVTRDQQVLWLRALIVALGQAPGGERHLVIKLDAWHVLDWGVLQAAFPEVPSIFLFRDPVEIAASMFTQPSAYMAAGMATAYNRDRHDAGNEAAMRMEDFIARDLGKVFAAGAELSEAASVIPVAYPSLPEAVWTRLREVLGLLGTDGELSQMLQTAAVDAKSPTLSFEPDSARKQRETSALLRELVTAQCAAPYARLLNLSAAVPR